MSSMLVDVGNRYIGCDGMCLGIVMASDTVVWFDNRSEPEGRAADAATEVAPDPVPDRTARCWGAAAAGSPPGPL